MFQLLQLRQQLLFGDVYIGTKLNVLGEPVANVFEIALEIFEAVEEGLRVSDSDAGVCGLTVTVVPTIGYVSLYKPSTGTPYFNDTANYCCWGPQRTSCSSHA